MAAGTYDFVIEQGATLELPLIWKDNAGNPINLTGYTARMHIRESIGSTSTLAVFTTENGGITLGTTGGEITIQADASATTAYSWSSLTGVYDLELVSPGGKVTRLLKGKVTLDPEVTR